MAAVHFRRALTVAPVAALVFALGVTNAAIAAWVNDFSIAAPSGFGGSGETQGEILYRSSDARRYDVSGSVRDRCPADGKGMALRVRARNAAGSQNLQTIIKDTNECGPDPVVQNFPLPQFTPFNIKDSRAELWTTEGGDPYSHIDSSTWKNRP